MVKLDKNQLLAIAAFVLPVVLALWPAPGLGTLGIAILVLVGVGLALMTVSAKERMAFVAYVTGLAVFSVTATVATLSQFTGTILGSFLTNLALVFGPALLFVALIGLYSIAKK